MRTTHEMRRDNISKTIRHGAADFEIPGRVENPKLAEAMAYAAKPLIDMALQDLKGPDNTDGLAVVKLPDGRTGLTEAPGVRLSNGRVRSFDVIRESVSDGHQAANNVEVGYHNRVAKARAAVRQVEADI